MSKGFDRGLETLRGQIDAKVNAFFQSCVHCGICAESCSFYTETGDPRYTPIYKTEPLRKLWAREYSLWGRLGKALGLSRAMTEEDLSAWEPLVYDGCSICGRCSMACPQGIDITGMIQKVRVALAAGGYSPNEMVDAIQRAIETGSPIGVQLPALKAQIRHIEQDTGLSIPVDVEGADYMALLSSMEIINFPEYIESLARIFKQAGVSWTLCSEAFEATNSGLQIGDYKVASELIERIVEGAEKLKVKNVISPECGHAFSALRWEGPNFIGRRYNFNVVHILELLDELHRQGRIKTKLTKTERLTFHDPCQIVRRGGVEAQPRHLLKSVSSNFVEMKEHGRMNWCCGGGGGVAAIERAEDLRFKAFNRKKAQLEELEVETIVSACSNCRLVMEDGLERNDMDIPIVGLTEIVASHLAEQD